VVRLLVAKGADVNTQGGYYGNALQAASERGHKAVVRLLLDKGTDGSTLGGFYGNTFQVLVLQYQGKYEAYTQQVNTDPLRVLDVEDGNVTFQGNRPTFRGKEKIV
jgi:ankyrin repeat protein